MSKFENKIREIDGKITDVAQESYLYLFDRTGIYIGDLLNVLVCVELVVDKLTTINVIVNVLMIAFGCYFRTLQNNGNHARINDSADFFRDSFFALFRIAVIFSTVLIVGIYMDVKITILHIVGILISYLMVLKVRDRDTDRFKKKVFAVQ